jgi:PEGA domain
MTRFAHLAAAAVALLGVPGVLPAVAVFAQVAETTASAPKQRSRINGRAYTLKIDSSPQQAAVYWDAAATPAPRDYGIAGYTPLTLVVPRGSVRVILEMKGFRTQERDVYIAKPETLLVTLEKAAQPAHLEVVAANDGGATGAEVSIDGVARGTLPNAFELVAGRHNLEVRKPGWKTLTKWIELAEDERRTIEVALERAESPPGTLLVTSDGPGEVYVDGVRKDLAPAVVTGLAPGEHVVEVRRNGIPPWRQSVTIAPGQEAKVSANLGGAVSSPEPASEAHGTADLGTVGKVRFLSSPPGAEVSLDGEPIGTTPIERDDIPAGEHLIVFKLSGYDDHKEMVTVVGGKDRLMAPDLQATPAGPRPEQLERLKTSMSSFGARVLPAGAFTADLALGYPYVLFARLTLGILASPGRGLDVGVEMQSFFQMWTGSLHARAQLAEAGPFSVGVRANAGAGAGANSKNTLFADLAGIASVDFAGVVSLSADLRLSLWSDQFCPKLSDVTLHGAAQSDYCKDAAFADTRKYPDFGGKDPAGQRFGGARLYMGLTLAVAIDRRSSFFARMDFIPGAKIVTFPDGRMAFEDRYNSIMLDHDPLYYGTVGFSFKF